MNLREHLELPVSVRGTVIAHRKTFLIYIVFFSPKFDKISLYVLAYLWDHNSMQVMKSIDLDVSHSCTVNKKFYFLHFLLFSKLYMLVIDFFKLSGS